MQGSGKLRITELRYTETTAVDQNGNKREEKTDI